MDKHHSDQPDHDQGQIPESTQYIQESTLIQETESHVQESSAIDLDADADHDGGLPGGTAPGLKHSSAKKAGFVKRNLPLVVVLMLGAGVGGSFLYKKFAMAPAQQVQQAQTAKQAEPSPYKTIPTPAAPTPLPSFAALPDMPATPVIAVVQAVPVPPTAPAATVTTAAPTKTVTSVTVTPATPVKPAAAAIPATTTVTTVTATPAMPSRAALAQRLPNESANESVNERRQIVQLQSELASANGKLEVTQASLRAAQDGLAESKRQLSAARTQNAQSAEGAAVAPSVVARKPRQARVSATRTPPRVSKVALAHADGYALSAVRNGLAWIETGEGLVIVKNGDAIAGLGKVTSVNEVSMQVVAGGKLID